MKSFILITCLLQTALAAPQLISFKDGKVGVNFFGYHAEAGLGGGQNGPNGGFLGGLHASAGTPWGQNAAAGLGGNVNGRAAGVLYAGAQATPNVGASSILGGDTSEGGFSGADAYANGKVSSSTRTITAGNTKAIYENAIPQYPAQPATENVNAIQKIRPPKKYYASELKDTPVDAAAAATATAAATTTIDLTKDTNKATLATALHIDEKDTNVAISKAPVEKLLNINANINVGKSHIHKFNAIPSTISTLSATPLNAPSFVSLSPGAEGVADNNPTDVIILTKEKTKFRPHAHKHLRNWQKRINANLQRHRSKSIVKIVEVNNQQQLVPQTYDHLQQQQPVRRQLIASPAVAVPCDAAKAECKSLNREVRSDVVHNALQIPVGILQSLQQTLGGLKH